MRYTFEYGEMLNCYCVSLILKVEDAAQIISMEKVNGVFRAGIECNEQEIVYKFILNNILRVNDANAVAYGKDENGEVWSKYINNSRRKQNEVRNFKYSVSNKKLKNCSKSVRTIIYPNESIVWLNVFLNLSNEIHSVTVIWYDVEGKISLAQEKAIDLSHRKCACNVKLNFCMNLDKSDVKEGIWKINLLIDGKVVIADYFAVTTATAGTHNVINTLV